MKNKVLKTIGYIVGITWLFTACALDDEVYGMTMLFINVLCMAYLALFSWANNWWYDLEDYEDEDDEECEEPLHYGSTLTMQTGMRKSVWTLRQPLFRLSCSRLIV